MPSGDPWISSPTPLSTMSHSKKNEKRVMATATGGELNELESAKKRNPALYRQKIDEKVKIMNFIEAVSDDSETERWDYAEKHDPELHRRLIAGEEAKIEAQRKQRRRRAIRKRKRAQGRDASEDSDPEDDIPLVNLLANKKLKQHELEEAKAEQDLEALKARLDAEEEESRAKERAMNAFLARHMGEM